MYNERITDKEGICILIIFFIGSSLIIGIGGAAKNDMWIAAIVGIIMAIPMLLVFSRILSLFPGKDLFDILGFLLGKQIGKFISVIYIWYAFHLGALVLRNFGEFINTVAMPETPIMFSLLFLGSACIVVVKLGIEVLGRTSAYFIPIIFFILILVQLLAVPQLHFENLKPFFSHGLMPILQGGFAAFSFPFGESVILLLVFNCLKSKNSPYRVYFWSLLICFIIILGTTVRNIAILSNMLEYFYFPSYAAVSRISMGEFIQRMEVTVSFVFVFSVFVKISICLLATCKGLSKLFHLSNYRSIVIQTGLLMIYFSYIVYDNIMEMKDWAFKVYPFYAFPMQVILPIIIWIIAEIKIKKGAISNS